MKPNAVFVLFVAVCSAVGLTVITIFLIPRPMHRPHAAKTPPRTITAEDEESMKMLHKLPTGIVAPEFTMENLATGQRVHLKELFGKKPIVLIFGSLT